MRLAVTNPNRKATQLMLSSLKERRDREDEGFTLIELMVVVLIIAILLAIAIPTFLGARNSANARATQSNLRNALTAEQTQWTNTQAFSGDLSSIESSLTWNSTSTWDTAATTNQSNEVMVAVSDNGNVVVLTGLGKDKNCWSVAQINDPNYASASPAIGPDGTYYQKVATSTGTCTSPAAPAAAATSGSAGNNTAAGWYTSF